MIQSSKDKILSGDLTQVNLISCEFSHPLITYSWQFYSLKNIESSWLTNNGITWINIYVDKKSVWIDECQFRRCSIIDAKLSEGSQWVIFYFKRKKLKDAIKFDS